MADTEHDNWNGAISDLLDKVLQGEAEERGHKTSEAEAKTAKQQAKTKVDSARKQLAEMLIEAGVTTENHPRATITLASGKVQLLVAPDADSDALPIDMVRIKKEANKAAIQSALVSGTTVPGYSLAQGDPSLRIKLKEQ